MSRRIFVGVVVCQRRDSSSVFTSQSIRLALFWLHNPVLVQAPRRLKNPKGAFQPHNPAIWSNNEVRIFMMDTQEDDFNGLGEGIDGLPKRLPEDCVEYSLFIIDARLKSQKELLSRLETVRKAAVDLADSLLKEYIWQRDGFKLEVESGKGMSVRTLHVQSGSHKP